MEICINTNIVLNRINESIQRLRSTSRERGALELMSDALLLGFLSLNDFDRVLDFGAGHGLSTRALTTITDSDNVTAIERLPYEAQAIINAGTLPHDRVIKKWGIEYLRELAETGSGKFTLITAIGLGPDYKGYLYNDLVAVSSQVLTENGKLFVSSDLKTMRAVARISKTADLPPVHIKENSGYAFASFQVLTRGKCLEFTNFLSLE